MRNYHNPEPPEQAGWGQMRIPVTPTRRRRNKTSGLVPSHGTGECRLQDEALSPRMDQPSGFEVED